MGLLVDADRLLREEGIAGDIYLFKNNTDSAGNTYGCHENYLVPRDAELGRLTDNRQARLSGSVSADRRDGPGRRAGYRFALTASSRLAASPVRPVMVSGIPVQVRVHHRGVDQIPYRGQLTASAHA